MNVLLLTNLFPNPLQPGRGIFTARLAKALSSSVNLVVAAPMPWFPGFPPFTLMKRWADFARIPGQYEIDGIPVYSPKYPMVPRLSEGMHARLMYYGIARTISRLHEIHHFDLINAHWLYPDAVVAQRIGKQLGIPVVATALGCDANLFLQQPEKRQQILSMARSVAGITAVSGALRDEMLAEGASNPNIAVIHNGVELDRFKPMDAARARASLAIANEPSIVFIGRLEEEKAVSVLVDAANLLKQQGRHFRIYLVGDGPDRNMLMEQANAAGLNEIITFVGTQPHEAIPVWLAAADVFCLPSKREGCPNVVLEALASGRPVVASKVGGIPELVNDSNGILVTPENAAALAKGLAEALERKWDHAAIRNAMQDSSWSSCASQYVEAYENVLQRTQGNPKR